MKYNEAIDMIRNGGRATNSKEGKWWIWFAKSYTKTSWPTRAGEPGDLMVGIDEQICNVFTFNNKYLHDDNWIVEKDGVVYEEYPIGKMRIIEQRVPIDIIKKYFFIKDRIGTEDEPEKLEDNDQKWEEIKMPIIADEVNEDWLEKKMLCFMNKYLYIHSGMNLDIKQGKCSNRACPFCFSQEQPTLVTTDQDSSEVIKSFSNGLKARSTAKEASDNTVKAVIEEANKVIDRPREKVTILYIINLVNSFCEQYCIARQSTSYEMMHLTGPELPAFKVLLEKLAYLVSLQEL